MLDNRGHQCIAGTQVARIGVEFGTQLRERNAETGRLDGSVVKVDFAANAASMGCAAWTATTLDEFAEALEQARAADGPALIVAQVEPTRYLSPNGAFWDIGVPLTSGRADIRERSAAHERGRKTQRFYGATRAPDATA